MVETAKPKLRALFIDVAYSLDMIRQKGHLAFMEARHAGGAVTEVWSVHPMADVIVGIARPVTFNKLLPHHVLVESTSGEQRPRFVPRPVAFLFSQIRLFRILVRIIRERGIDLIVTGDPFYTALLSLALRVRTKVPVVVCAWGNYDLAFRTTGYLAMRRLIPNYRLQQWITRFTLSRADRVVVGNGDNKKYVLDNNAPPERTSVVPVASNLQPCHYVPPGERKLATHLLEGHGIDPKSPCMIYVGRLISPKFPEDAVRAMIAVIEQMPEAVGIVAGDGGLADDLKAMVARAGMSSRFIFTGNISQQELSEVLPLCVTVSPLTGMALIEAGLAGSPIVAFDADWQAEFVRDGENGFVVRLHDVEAMSLRTLEILRDRSLRDEMSRNGRSIALEFADQRRAWSAQHQAYLAALSR